MCAYACAKKTNFTRGFKQKRGEIIGFCPLRSKKQIQKTIIL